MKNRVALMVLLGLGLGASGARAAIIGSSVTGSFLFTGSPTNYYDPANGAVPATGFLNAAGPTVTIQEPSVEFGAKFTGDQFSANFTAGQLLFQNQSLAAGTSSVYTMTFTDSAFAGLVVTPVVSTFPTAPTVSVTGTTLTITYPTQAEAANTLYLSLFNLTTTPEPASLGVAGLTAVAGLARRRRVG